MGSLWLTSSGLKAENQYKSSKSNLLIWLKSCSKRTCLCLMPHSSQPQPSTKSITIRLTAIGKVSSLSLQAISTLSKSTSISIRLEPLQITKSLRSSIVMVSIKLKTTSKLLMDISLSPKDCQPCSMFSIGTVNQFFQSMTPKTGGLSTKLQAKVKFKRDILKVPIFLWSLCQVDTPCRMEGLLLTGTLPSEETKLIPSAGQVFQLSMTKVSEFGS